MSDKKEITIPIKSQKEIMDAHPEHYGKWVLIKSFNDNMIVAYGETMEDMQEDATSKGFRVVGHRDDSEEERKKVGVSMYCHTPCEMFIGGPVMKTFIKNEVFVECEEKPQCPVCKHRKDE